MAQGVVYMEGRIEALLSSGALRAGSKHHYSLLRPLDFPFSG